MVTTTSANTFLQRLIGALALDAAIYEEVEADRSATRQAFLVLLLSSLATGIGARGFGNVGAASIAFFACLSLMAWAAWALLTYEIGVNLLPSRETRSSVGELLRTLGFASTPGLMNLLGVLPAITGPVFAVTSVWMLLAMIVAVRQSLDYQSTGRAVAVCVAGWMLTFGLVLVIGLIFSPSVR
jgi:hypothetical protein